MIHHHAAAYNGNVSSETAWFVLVALEVGAPNNTGHNLLYRLFQVEGMPQAAPENPGHD